MASQSHRIRFNFWLNMNKLDEELIADKIEHLKTERSFTSVIRDGIRLICDLREGKLDILFELFPWVRAEFLEYMREVAPKSIAIEPVPQRTANNQQIEAEKAWIEAEQERIEQERAWEERRIAEAKQALEVERQQIEKERKHIKAERQQNQSAIQKQLERLEELLLQQGNRPIEKPMGGLQPITLEQPQKGDSPKKLSAQQFKPPTFDDDDDDMPLLEIKKDTDSGNRATQNFLNSLMNLQNST